MFKRLNPWGREALAVRDDAPATTERAPEGEPLRVGHLVRCRNLQTYVAVVLDLERISNDLDGPCFPVLTPDAETSESAARRGLRWIDDTEVLAEPAPDGASFEELRESLARECAEAEGGPVCAVEE